jgi:general secretion pathway protein D
LQPVVSNSSIGTVPGKSASAAAPAAMAQMKAASGTNMQVPQTNIEREAQAANPTPLPPPPLTSPQPGAAATGPTVNFLLNSPGPVTNGSTFQVPVIVSNAADIASVPLQIQYDPGKLSLVNVDSGDFLSTDGQAVSLAHRDDGPGMITINASRPPGATGINGAGVVCVLSFQAKSAGDSKISITRPGAMNSAQKPVPAQGSELTVSVK